MVLVHKSKGTVKTEQ